MAGTINWMVWSLAKGCTILCVISRGKASGYSFITRQVLTAAWRGLGFSGLRLTSSCSSLQPFKSISFAPCCEASRQQFQPPGLEVTSVLQLRPCVLNRRVPPVSRESACPHGSLSTVPNSTRLPLNSSPVASAPHPVLQPWWIRLYCLVGSEGPVVKSLGSAARYKTSLCHVLASDLGQVIDAPFSLSSSVKWDLWQDLFHRLFWGLVKTCKAFRVTPEII